MLLGAAAVAVLLVGLYASWQQHQNNRKIEQVAAQAVQAANDGQPSDAPSTKKPDSATINTYRVAADAPRYLSIPKLSVKAMVKPMGVTAENEIQSPRNVFDAGWYSKSAKPGAPGAMVVGGHVSSWRTAGVFHGLKKLKPGDTISIERGDAATITYTVVKSHTYEANKVDMQAVLAPVNAKKPGLNLITCAGSVSTGNEYDKRLVVFAEMSD